MSTAPLLHVGLSRLWLECVLDKRKTRNLQPMFKLTELASGLQLLDATDAPAVDATDAPAVDATGATEDSTGTGLTCSTLK
jgi:hypothetical protein